MKLLRFFLYVLLALAVLFLLLFKPTSAPAPYAQSDYYQTTVSRLDSALATVDTAPVDTVTMPTAHSDTLYAGWARQNITPRQPTKLMGYGWKGNFERVRDSLWVRSLVFQQGSLTVALISYDLMLTPPAVARAVRQRLTDRGLPNCYFTAVHTHHGFGEWQTGPAGTFITGGYHQALVDTLVHQTVASVLRAQAQLRPTRLRYARYDRSDLVSNRLVENGPVDPYLRVVYLEQDAATVDAATAMLTSFAAHATFLSSRTKDLSADYPGAVVRALEARPDVDFAQWAAGAVGSHRPHRVVDETMEAYAQRLLSPMAEDTTQEEGITTRPMRFAEVPIELPEPQLRLFAGWQVRPWLFRWFFGDITPTLTLFQLGPVVLLGIPADFSGLLYPAIGTSGHEVMITSFNGDYIGYVIPDAYYQLPHREARETNWYGPHTGSYLVDLINRMLRQLPVSASPPVTDSTSSGGTAPDTPTNQ
ncbi:MAG: neutral/alkaline non-lysosomal ceramidase N-terminal domain-containing protein [Tunicatimonas sp.]